MSLYTELIAAGIPTDSHESDLYVLATPAAADILARHGRTICSHCGATWPCDPSDDVSLNSRERAYHAPRNLPRHNGTFISQVDGKRWYDVPFAFEPFWERVAAKGRTS